MNDLPSNQFMFNPGQRLPLQDLVFLNTRPLHQAHELTQLLHTLGGKVIEFPLLEIVPMEAQTKAQLLSCLENAPLSTWLVFTSSNGVEEVCRQVLDRSAEILAGEKLCVLQTAVIGEKTAQVALRWGLSVSFISEETNSDDFSRAFVEFLSKEIPDSASESDAEPDALPSVLVLRGKVASEDLTRNFSSAKVDFTCLDIYDSQACVATPLMLQALMAGQGLQRIDLALFTSSLAVKVFFQRFVGCDVSATGDRTADRVSFERNVKRAMVEIPCAVIGPRTRTVAEELGLPVVVMPRHASVEALVDEIVKYFSHIRSKDQR